VPWEMVLASPEGTRHLAFDRRQGTWLRIFQDRREQRLRASEALLLRPSDVDTIIRWTVEWCMGKGLGSDRATELVDDLANGVRVVILYFAERAGHS